MRFFGLLRILLLGCASLVARAETISVSTNNTPLDRLALERLSAEIFGRLGLDFRLVSLPSERSLVAANLGEVDGEGLRVAGLTASYPNLVQVPERFLSISFVAFARNANLRLDQGWRSLAPHSVAFLTGWKMFEANVTGVRRITQVDRPEQLFKMLDSGRVDLALYTLADGVALIHRMGLSSLVPLDPPLADVDLYLYLNQRHQDLVPKISQVLRQMKADGTYDRILASIGAGD